MGIQILSTINDNRWDVIKTPPLEMILEATFKTLEIDITNKTIELSLLYTNDPEIQHFNKQYRAKDKPTNSLSFPMLEFMDEGIKKQNLWILGDIIFSIDTLEKESIEQNKLLEHHFIHLFVHGLLHLLGYDHIKDDEALIMENIEIRILNLLNISNPY